MPAEEPFYAPEDGTVDLRDLFDILLRGKWILLACMLMLALPVGVWTFLQPNQYTSYAVIQVDKKDSNLGGILSESPAAMFAEKPNLDNELLVVRQSYPLAQRVAQSILTQPTLPGTNRAPTILEPTLEGTAPGVLDIVFRLQTDYISAVQEGQDVDAIRVSGISEDPVEAAFLANAYADAFSALTRTQSRASVSASREFLEEQVQQKGADLAGDRKSVV